MEETKKDFNLSDEHVEDLKKQSQELNSAYAIIGKQVLSVFKNIKNTLDMENALRESQERISRDLGVENYDQLIWNLGSKILTAIKNTE